MARYGMVIDLSRCHGCRACMVACKVENNTPKGSFWNYVFRFEEGVFPETRVSFLPRPCMHCDNAPCVKVCPVGSRHKTLEGLTLTDGDRCIGCRYCEVACPYGVNCFNWKDPKKNRYLDWSDPSLEGVELSHGMPYANPDLDLPQGSQGRHTAGGGRMKGVVEKCTFCVHRLEKGLLPACAANCPVGALVFGDLDDPESPPSQLLREKPHFRLLEGEGTEPRVYYVGGAPPTTASRQIEAVKARVER